MRSPLFRELPEERFEFPFILIGKWTMAFVTGQSCRSSQILVHRWGAENKNFGALLQTDFVCGAGQENLGVSDLWSQRRFDCVILK